MRIRTPIVSETKWGAPILLVCVGFQGKSKGNQDFRAALLLRRTHTSASRKRVLPHNVEVSRCQTKTCYVDGHLFRTTLKPWLKPLFLGGAKWISSIHSMPKYTKVPLWIIKGHNLLAAFCQGSESILELESSGKISLGPWCGCGRDGTGMIDWN